MRVSFVRNFVGWILAMLMPLSLPAQIPEGQSSGAILHAQAGVWVNGSEARDSTAVFPGDLVETKTGFTANLTLKGSTILLGSESVTKFQGDFLELDHGIVSVGTSSGFQVRVNCIRVVPVLNEWTQYDVTDVNRTVQVSAKTSDVNVEHAAAVRKASPQTEASQHASVHQGEQHNYDETEICGAPGGPAHPGGINPKWIEIGAGAGGGILGCVLFFCHSSPGPTKPPPLSQWSP